jgi:acetylornithine deacetylase/succinyl-diaminopimelate desuccinylase-like protein
MHWRTPLLTALLLALLCDCNRGDAVPRDPTEPEAEQLLSQYIRVDTSNPPGNETNGAKLLQQVLANAGIESRLLGSNPARQSLYARLRGNAGGEKALLLLHHIDVVPATASEWTVAPFSGERANGYLWGRGALDAKSLGVAELMAFRELKKSGAKLNRDVIYLAVADEETGGVNGTAALLRDHPDLFADVGFVLNEGGTNRTVVDQVKAWGIEVQQKQPLWLRLTAAGAAGHGSTPPSDGGAIARLVEVLADIRRMDVARARSVPARVLNNGGIGGGEFLQRDTITFTGIGGGSNVNSVPAHAWAEIDCRVLPEGSTETLKREIEKVVGSRARVEVLLQGSAVAASPANTPLFSILQREMLAAAPHSRVEAIVSPGTTDSRYFRARGVVAYGIAPFKINFYDGPTIHGVDERIRLRNFAEGVRLMRRIVTAFAVDPAK